MIENKYNIFMDESCHLEHDKIRVMCIGYVKVPEDSYKELKKMFIDIKLKHRTPVELKWNKFSKSRLPLYKELVDCFFDNPIDFRSVLIKHKDRLRHEDFNLGSHDNYYYKLIYFLLRPNPPESEYRVFIDIKDTKGKERLVKIDQVFTNLHHGGSPFTHFQHLHSHENVFFQLADFFIGAITYRNRLDLGEFSPNDAKMEFIHYLESKSGFLLNEGTAPWHTKFNIFNHQPQIR